MVTARSTSSSTGTTSSNSMLSPPRAKQLNAKSSAGGKQLGKEPRSGQHSVHTVRYR